MLSRKTPLVWLLACLTALLLLCANAFGQDMPLWISEVKTFQKNDQINSSSKWLQIRVCIESANNPNPNAMNKDYFERVTVEPIFAWGSKRQGNFSIEAAFSSKVEISAMKVRSKRYVYFYLPPEVVDMWRLRSSMPDFYYIGLTYDGVQVKPNAKSVPTVMADTIKDPAVLESFKQFCAEKTARTKGILLPHNLAPWFFYQSGSVDKDTTVLTNPAAQ